MSNKIVITFLFVLSILAGLETKSQSNPYNEVSIASPTAASLGKYADIPVNYHTGIPQVSIPIYSIKEGPLNLPIGLNYHASGLKVMETSSWVGAGWSLSCGGVITRTVQGAPDERQTSNTYNQTHGHLSDGGYNKYFWIPGGSPQPPPSLTWAPQNEMQDWSSFLEGKKDGEPDLFFFNFAGYSGKFYFHDDGSAVLVPEQDIKIEYNYTPGVGNSISNFTITTPDGTKYSFGKTISTTDVDPIETTNPVNGDAGLSVGTAISSWYLNKIVSADDLFSITLSYVTENYSYYTISMFPVADTAQSSRGYKPVKNIISGVRLSRVLFSNGQVDFIPSATPRIDLNGTTALLIDDANTQAKSLASIQISNATAAICKRFDLSYSYFDDLSSTLAPGLVNIVTDRKRLKLNSLQEQSCDGSIVIPPHLFTYFTESVPRRFSFAQDHWGFINDATNNTSLIPTYTLNSFTTVNGANRGSAWPAMRGGSLKKITYPTGGYADFEFEPNYTWVSYNQSAFTFRFSASAGYDGSSLPVTQYQPFTSNSYRITFTNSSLGSQALLNIFNSGNVNVKGYVLEVGQSFSEIFQLPIGTYRIEIKKIGAVSGNGAQANFEEFAATSIQKNEVVGGLRIKTVIVNDGIIGSNNILTTYAYETAGKSTGTLYSRPAYVYIIRNDILRDIGYADGLTCSVQGCIGCDGYPSVGYGKSPSGIRPMETTQGNHIGYNEVKVSKPGNGYSIYKYYESDLWKANTGEVAIRNLNTAPCDATVTNFPFAPFPCEFMRGELKYEGHYNESTQLLKESAYYPVYQNNSKTTPAFIASYNFSSLGGAPLATFYTLSTARKTQTGATETVYGTGGSIQTTSYSFFESPFHNQPTRTSSVSSTGQAIETKIKYAQDFRIPGCDVISDCLSAYNAAVNSAIILRYSRSCSDHTCRWWAWQAYIKDLSIARSNYINCRKANYTGSANAFSACLINSKNTADAWLKPIIDLQLQFNNPAIESSSWKAAQLLTASFNKFDYVAIPATKPYISKVLSLPVATPSATFTPANTSSNSITKDSRYVDETNIKFDGGVISELTKKDGITTSYLWDYNKTQPVAQATSADIAYTSFEADGKGNWIFAGSSITDLTAPTGKKAYDLSGGNLTKSITSIANYIVSYWRPVSLTALTITGTITGFPIIGRIVNGWKYYEHKITGQTLATISGTGLIDELRLYPTNAQMTTYTYDPLIGMTSQSDANNRITYYEYDAFNRLSLIRDQDKNILKKICYNYASQVENCSVNVSPSWAATGNLRCATSGGINTGYQEREERDNNPNSPTYNQTQWVMQGYITTSCPLPAPPCSISISSGYSMLTSGISSSGATVSFYIVFNPSSTMQPGNNYYVATVNGGCRPSTTRTIGYSSSGRNWTITIYPSGQMYWYLSPGSTSVSAGTTIGTGTLTYNL